MATNVPTTGDITPRRAAFLLSQVGAWAAEQFGERVAEAGLTRAEAGLLWIIDGNPGVSQQHLAELLAVAPSRMVALLDDLATRGLVQRVRSITDRRVSATELTDDGHDLLAELGDLARRHEREVCAPLDDDEHRHLVALLSRLADHAGLAPRVHPGHRTT